MTMDAKRDFDVLRARLRSGRYNQVEEDDLITANDLGSLLDEIERLRKELGDALMLLGREMLKPRAEVSSLRRPLATPPRKKPLIHCGEGDPASDPGFKAGSPMGAKQHGRKEE